MLWPDIWQAIGTPQVAEITAVVSTAITIALAQGGRRQQTPQPTSSLKKIPEISCAIIRG